MVPTIGLNQLLASPCRWPKSLSTEKATTTSYCQPYDEWVVLLEGSAHLIIAGEATDLTRGDWLFLPAMTLHTVVRTSDGACWLAVKTGETT